MLPHPGHRQLFVIWIRSGQLFKPVIKSFSCQSVDQIKGKAQILHGAVTLHEVRGTSDPTLSLQQAEHATDVGFQPLLRYQPQRGLHTHL